AITAELLGHRLLDCLPFANHLRLIQRESGCSANGAGVRSLAFEGFPVMTLGTGKANGHEFVSIARTAGSLSRADNDSQGDVLLLRQKARRTPRRQELVKSSWRWAKMPRIGVWTHRIGRIEWVPVKERGPHETPLGGTCSARFDPLRELFVVKLESGEDLG